MRQFKIFISKFVLELTRSSVCGGDSHVITMYLISMIKILVSIIGPAHILCVRVVRAHLELIIIAHRPNKLSNEALTSPASHAYEVLE
jgi:hypothetical protein